MTSTSTEPVVRDAFYIGGEWVKPASGEVDHEKYQREAQDSNEHVSTPTTHSRLMPLRR